MTEQPAVTPLTDEEIARLWGARTEAEWTSACVRIKSIRGGSYPPDWYPRVLRSGLMDTVWADFPPAPEEPPYESLSYEEQMRQTIAFFDRSRINRTTWETDR